MPRHVQLPTLAGAIRPGAIPGRIIGGRELELQTSPLTTDSDGRFSHLAAPAAATRPGAFPAARVEQRTLMAGAAIMTRIPGPTGICASRELLGC